MRPRPLTPMTHFRVTPFDGFVGFQHSGGSGAALEGVASARRRLLGCVATPPPRGVTASWRSGAVGDHRASSLDVDRVNSSADSRDEVNKQVEELDDCDHIDVDTVDDPTPPSAAASAECFNTSSLGKVCMIRIRKCLFACLT